MNENVPSTSHTSDVFHFKVCVTLCLEKENGIYTDQTFRGLPTHTSNHVVFFFFFVLQRQCIKLVSVHFECWLQFSIVRDHPSHLSSVMKNRQLLCGRMTYNSTVGHTSSDKKVA